MGSHTLEIFLQQHTPIIHFQHTQAGATLRATEVKPKLDRFLMEKISGEKDVAKAHAFMKKEKPGWLVGKGKAEHVALDYRMSFEVQHRAGQQQGNWLLKVDKYPLYFGNLGNENESNKHFIFHSTQSIKMSIFCLNNNLRKLIDEHIDEFFALHNFGTRQTKGFGKFFRLPDEHSGTLAELLERQKKNYDYEFTVKVTQGHLDALRSDNIVVDDPKFYILCKHIDLFYRTLRGGINEIGRNQTRLFYFKSLLFHNVKATIKWDKRAIKENFFGAEQEAQRERLKEEGRLSADSPIGLNYQNKSRKLIRDMLGLSTEESWKSYGRTITKSEADNQGRELNANKQEIQRVPSPITFHVFHQSENQYRVFLKFEPIRILGKKFLIKGAGKPFDLQVPDAFSLHDFFKDTVMKVKDDFDAYANCYDENKGRKTYNMLHSIYIKNLKKVNP
jgi:hypothetical protein